MDFKRVAVFLVSSQGPMGLIYALRLVQVLSLLCSWLTLPPPPTCLYP